ncbi:carboxy-S-adenosyl-L-methionine synthase CmoA [Gallaecimonas sp. GXIMD4217]|uniref:carboxy-S-adenosyl-L-methionine synthase CmoA n=1 Tax=Gallaecimonas sp. GXIMD4217 TaxID=3131927 RepID=UPI00311AC819
MAEDKIYAQPLAQLKDFTFDEQVAEVFNDMINRSVPGYGTIIKALGRMAPRFVRPGSSVYDLGCSLGAASLAIKQSLDLDDVNIVAVDNAQAMVERARRHLSAYKGKAAVEVRCADIRDVKIENASLVVLNFTLQFLDPKDRDALIQRIHDGLNPGGLLVLSEKLVFEDAPINELLIDLHHDFKRDNGYSDLEISQKRNAIENVMRPDTLATHERRFEACGFSHHSLWFQCYNFASMVAIK